jgi:hypothetical protein
MFNINTQETKMTIYYWKSSGEIRDMSTGVQDMSTYGEHQKDYELILDYIVVDLDMYVYDNPGKFEIKDGALKLKQEASNDLSKYM